MATDSGVKSDPICGACNEPRSKHHHEDEDYCYPEDTFAQDAFTDEPSDHTFVTFMMMRFPVTFESVVKAWRKENGHE